MSIASRSICSDLLSKTTAITGSFCSTAVSMTVARMMNAPSPRSATAGLPPLAILAPIAAEALQPMRCMKLL
ncbi:hypothetical protein D9M68_886950 [compost metagenome]